MCLCVSQLASQPAVTQQNTARVELRNIPEITNMMEGGERKLGLFSSTVAAYKSGVGKDTHTLINAQFYTAFEDIQ